MVGFGSILRRSGPRGCFATQRLLIHNNQHAYLRFVRLAGLHTICWLPAVMLAPVCALPARWTVRPTLAPACVPRRGCTLQQPSTPDGSPTPYGTFVARSTAFHRRYTPYLPTGCYTASTGWASCHRVTALLTLCWVEHLASALPTQLVNDSGFDSTVQFTVYNQVLDVPYPTAQLIEPYRRAALHPLVSHYERSTLPSELLD